MPIDKIQILMIKCVH